MSHRSLQVERADDVAASIRTAMKHIKPENLIVSSDCGFGRQGRTATSRSSRPCRSPRACNIVRRELGLEPTYVPGADPILQTDIVPKTAR